MSMINNEITNLESTQEDQVPDVDYLKEDYILKTQKVLTYKDQKEIGLFETKDINCSICLLDIKEYKPSPKPKYAGNVCELSCGHLFHQPCVFEWLTK